MFLGLGGKEFVLSLGGKRRFDANSPSFGRKEFFKNDRNWVVEKCFGQDWVVKNFFRINRNWVVKNFFRINRNWVVKNVLAKIGS